VAMNFIHTSSPDRKIAYPFADKPALAIPLREPFAPPIRGRGATRYIVLS
jgi:hypothetical protein